MKFVSRSALVATATAILFWQWIPHLHSALINHKNERRNKLLRPRNSDWRWLVVIDGRRVPTKAIFGLG
jgi:hypothetical protein